MLIDFDPNNDHKYGSTAAGLVEQITSESIIRKRELNNEKH
jgi:hypothetical protein